MNYILRQAALDAVLGISSLGLTLPAPETSKTPTINLGPLIPVSPPGSSLPLLLNRASGEAEGRVLMICGERPSPLRNTHEGFVYASYDGGRTWIESLVESSSAWVSEPSCALGVDNRAYFIAGVSNADRGYARHEFGRMYLYSSTDGGRTWGSPSIGPFLDWTGVIVDQNQGANRGRIYVWANHVTDGRGSWSPPRPALFTSTDGGRTLLDPVTPTTPSTFKRVGAFPSNGVVLDNGTVVTPIAGGRAEGQGFVSLTNPASKVQMFAEVLRSTDGGRTLGDPIVLGKLKGLEVSLVVDRKTGTLFTAWMDENEGRNRIMLARSRDQGSTWLSNVAIEGDAGNRAVSVGSVSIAVGREGLVGLVWPAGNGTCARFAVSGDHGRTFGNPIDLNPCEEKLRLRPEAYSENLFSVQFMDASPGQKLDPEIANQIIDNRGLSIRINMNKLAWGRTELLVDGSGRFHPIWGDGREGPTSLWTRTVTLGDAPTPSMNVDHLTDISKLIHIRLTNNRFHLRSATFFVDLALLNNGANTICGPVRIVADGLRSEYGLPEIDNADNGVRGDGAIWDMTDELEGGMIRPWSPSMPRTLAFKVKNLVEHDEGNPTDFGLHDPVVVGFKVFGNTGAASKSACGTIPGPKN